MFEGTRRVVSVGTVRKVGVGRGCCSDAMRRTLFAQQVGSISVEVLKLSWCWPAVQVSVCPPTSDQLTGDEWTDDRIFGIWIYPGRK